MADPPPTPADPDAPSPAGDAARDANAHLRAVLRALRALHMLIAREQDPVALIERAARLLVDERGFLACAIALFAPGTRTIERFSLAGKALQSTPFASLLDGGELTPCLKRASEGAAFIRERCNQVCESCPVEKAWSEPRDSVAVPLQVDGHALGALLLTQPPGTNADPDEIALVQEVAESLSHALFALQQQRALHEREAQYRRLIEDVFDVVWLVDLSTMRPLHISPTVEKLRGFSVEETLRQDLSAFLTPASASYVGEVLPGRVAEFERGVRRTYVDEIALPHKDGSTVWTETAMRFERNPSTGKIELYGISRDISARRSAQDALTESEEHYRALIDNLGEVVFSTSVEGRITYASPAVASFGYTPADLLGKPLSAVVYPDDLAHVEATRPLAFAGPSEPIDFRILDKGGRVRHVRTSRRAIHRHGKLIGLTGVLIDLTNQHEAEERFRAAQKMEAIGRLAGGIAHDFNNLLTVISSYTEFVSSSLPDSDPLLADLAEVSKASLRAQALTRQLLAFSRKQMLKPQIVDLNSLVAGVEKMLGRLIGEDITLAVTPGANLGLVKVDPGQMEQVLMNLAVNARDAMPQGGTVAIATENVEAGETGPAALGGPAVKITFTDTGCGMDEATLNRIFEPFFTTKSPHKGTGLGLSTVYGIIEQSGGRITAQSRPGLGTRFEIRLPRTDATRSAPPAPEAAEHPPAAGSETLLVVEDEPGVRELACRILTSAGYKVVSAANGEEALRQLDQLEEEPALVLTDVVMPGMSGRELADRVTARRPGLKVLYMSGYTDDAILRQGGLEGRQLVNKPFDARTLTRMVREVLDKAPGSGA
ncbi:MAG: PAS domain S-box protein [Byssovorax sp.]